MVLVNNYGEHHQNWLKSFNDPELSDVVFEAKDGQIFHCEKIVLEVASPHFKNLFSSSVKSSRPDERKFVSARDVDPAALKWILRACYTADGDLDDDNVVSVMLAAGRYKMEWVEKACMKYLKDMSGPAATFEYSHDNEKWQEWRVPRSGWYHIVALGAKAADAPKENAQLYRPQGGIGVVIGASFKLEADDVIQILTGGMSRPYNKNPMLYTGGGGGTFVALKKKSLSLLLAAGGGGSIDQQCYGSDGNLGESGIGSSPGSVGGKNGGNGADSGAKGMHKGGLGWKAGPDALAKPRGADSSDNGGFGGGGYSGGSGVFQCGAGGGGSYVAPDAENSWKKVDSFGHGKVFIWGGKEVPTEEMFFLQQVGETGEIKTSTKNSKLGYRGRVRHCCCFMKALFAWKF
ncbi:hypothetical protein BSKO_02911 [Bryopsis sp. KO-2023]|nr:hypothetical protein BSKO_02911 [Bryopsis sp. KO-2023]